LLLSIFKFDRMEWAIEKCTELGVAKIIPVIAQRTERHLAQAAAKRVERWRRIAQQASEQARRAGVPEIDDPTMLKDALQVTPGLRILLDETDQNVPLKDLLRHTSAELSLATGPEGGWTPTEVACFHSAGWLSASLGSTILRVETAAIAALAIAVNELS
jgi:16S rRNA (uracil1498-N3)-methyltransferase